MAQNNYTIEEIINIARPNSADSSVRAYARLIKKVKQVIPASLVNPTDPSHAWINDIKRIDEYLNKSNLKDSTKRNYYVALMILVEGINGGPTMPHIWTKLDNWIHYNTFVDEINKNYMEKQKSGELTESQKDNMATKEEILKMIKDMKTKLPLQQVPYVLFNIYMELPVRNEIANLKIIKKLDYNRLIKHKNDTENYLLIEKTKMFIIRNKFKTSNSPQSGGQKISEISKPLKRIIHAYIKQLDPEDNRLFPTLYPKPNKDGAMPEYSTPELNLTKLLTRTTEKLLNGKKISTTILAKLTTTHTLENTPPLDVPSAIIKIADVRGTSLNMSVPIYTNNNNSGGSDGTD